MTIITIASSKGGAGKTTTSITIAYALAEQDSTLLVDLDTQGHAAMTLGVEPTSGVFDWLVGQRINPLQPRPQRPLFDLLPGDTRTKTVDAVYRAEVDGAKQLVSKIKVIDERHRWVIIDTAAAGLLQEAAIAAANIVVVPYRTERYGVDGVYGALALIERLNVDAQIIVVPLAYNQRYKDHRDYVEEIDQLADEGITVVPPIPARIAVERAIRSDLTIWEHSTPALADVKQGYQAVVELIKVGNP